MTYRVVICEAGHGRFLAVVDGTEIAVTSRDPEHAICRAMVEADLPDGPVEFIHGPSGMVAMRAKSAHAMAKWTVVADDKIGYRRRLWKNRHGEPGRASVDGDLKSSDSGDCGEKTPA